jgi:hypothetical protein
MIPQRKKRPSVQHTRLRFGRREPQPAPRWFPPYYWQTWESMDLSEYDDDLIELKRRAEANGHYLQIPKRGAVLNLPEPIDFGESLSDIVIRNRGREPER